MRDWFDIVFVAVVLVLGYGGTVYILWRYPDFRRALVAYFRPSAIASRLDAWVKRQKAHD